MCPTRRKRYKRSPDARLESHQRILCLLAPLTLGLLLLGALVVRPLALRYSFLAPFFERSCVFRIVSGLPCPFCGLTRATVAACSGKWLLSVLFHPLGVVLTGGGGLIALWLTACAVSGRKLGMDRAYRLMNHRGSLWILLGLLAAIWARQIWVSIYVWPLPPP